MFEDYKKDLLKFYQIKKENHLLAENLESLGREKLKKECIKVFKLKNTQKDKDFIQSVFDPEEEYEDQIRSIEKFDLDKFRPLISFLTEKVKTIRDDKLVKLFAWLIDFPTNEEWREFSEVEKKRFFEDAAKKKEIRAGRRKTSGGNKGTKTDSVKTRLIPPNYIILSCIILLFISTTSFVAWENSTASVKMPEADEKCMYWSEDHYEPVKCNAQIANATIIPLNVKKLQHQRKINLSDTLTSYSLGKVWYKGFVKDHEFFTDSGAYPQDIQRVLKPLTNTILTKYTSNYRYMLTRLVWFLCAAVFISLCGFAVSKLEKEVEHSGEETETEKEEITEFQSNELQATGM